MHTVRRMAHREASYSDGGPNYNPFARKRSRTPSDVENQVRRTQSENFVEPAIQEQRRLESRQAENEFGLPQHAGTAPPMTPISAAGSEHEQGPSNEKTMASHYPSTSNESADVSDRTAVEKSQPGVQKRARFKKMFHKNATDEEQADLEHVDSTLSFKERQRRALQRKIPIGKQIHHVLFGSWINVLLVFVPVGFAVSYAHIKGGDVPVFIINFIAIIPLAAILSYATEELAIRVGETMGGLLNATFGNAVELIVSVQALIKNEITIVKTSLIGSMLSNLLLVLGMAFVVGGYNRHEQHFNITVAQTAASLLALCIASLIIPTVFHNMLLEDAGPDGSKNQELSRGTAIILLFVYACYLLFQLKTHAVMYNAPSQKTPVKPSSKVEEGSAARGIATIGAGTAAAAGGDIHANPIVKQSEEDKKKAAENEQVEEPELSVIGALITLAISTTLVAFCSEFMVSSIEGVTATGKVSTTFIGLILLPIVGNAAEHATAVMVAKNDKMDLSIGVAVGSSMQIALLVLPFIVVLGWILGKECMTLYFDTFQIALLFVAVLLVNYLIQDGKSHWLEGVLLMSSYVIISLAAWFYPNIEETHC